MALLSKMGQISYLALQQEKASIITLPGFKIFGNIEYEM